MLSYFRAVGDFISQVKGFRRLALAFGLGFLSALAFAPYPGFALFLLGIAFCLLLVEAAENTKQAFWVGLFFGLGQFGLGVHWIGYSFLAQAEVPTWLAPIAVAILAFYLSLFTAGAFALAKFLWPKRWPAKAVGFAGSFALFEFLRGLVFTGFPWNPAAAIWWPIDSMMQSVSLVGTYGLGLITVLAGGLLASLFVRSDEDKNYFVFPVAALGVLFVLAGFGLIRLADSPVTYFKDVKLRLVQANIPQIEKWDENYLERNFERHIQMSNQTGDEAVTHVIWPETSIPYDVYNDPTFQAYLAARLGNDRILISGANRFERGGGIKVFNSVFALLPEGTISATYDKAHLVPFGEFIPWRGVLSKIGLDTLAPGSFNFSEGPGPRTLSIPDTPSFGPLVCYEIIFPGHVTDPGNRPAWLLNLTNDAWFGTSSGPHQHFALARLRAIEEGLAVVRVAGTGISGVIDPYGRVIGKTNLQTRGILDTGLPKPLNAAPLFARFGNLFLFIFLALVFGWNIWEKRKITQTRKKL